MVCNLNLRCLFFMFYCSIAFLSCTKKEQLPYETCYDGIKNQNESEIDCGGVCPLLCMPSMSAKINGNSWNGDTIKASYNSGSSTFSLKGSIANSYYPLLQLFYVGQLNTGTHALSNSTSYVPQITSFVSFNSGIITLTSLDTRNRLLTGSFYFTCTDNSSGTLYSVNSGVFENVKY